MHYKRIDGFKEYLQEIQGNGNLYIDKNFICIIQEELCGKEIDAEGIKIVLKKYNAKKYYEYIPTFLKHFNKKVVNLTSDEENTLCLLFECISNNFSVLFPEFSFFPYHYVTYKLFEYIKHPDLILLIDIKKIKDIDKLRYYDEQWKQICDELDWIFISSAEC